MKPKELDFLGLDEFVDANPSATTREAVEGISGNKVRISQDVRSGEGEALDFDVSYPDLDPLDGSPLHQFEVDSLLDAIRSGDEFETKEVISVFNESNPQVKAKTIGEIDDFLASKGEYFDDLIDNIAKSKYDDSPYEMVTPMGDRFTSGTFAFGNEDSGYSLFVDGQRVTDNDNIAYSRTESEVQLQQKLGLMDDADFGGTEYKEYIDQNLPGGENYREVVFNWDNAPSVHTYGHLRSKNTYIDGEKQIAHALIRDRTLDDGTPSLHIDELQSDLHTTGSKEGYKIPLKQKEEVFRKAKDFLKDNEKYRFDIRRQKDTIGKGLPGIVDRETNGFISFKRLKGDLFLDWSSHPRETFFPFDEVVSGLPDSYMPGVNKAEFFSIIKPIMLEGQVPNYPFKDNWHEMVLKNLLSDAAREGKPALSVSGSHALKDRWSDQYSKFYEMLYDKKVPSFMKKLAKRYGGEFEQGKLDLADTFGEDGVRGFIRENIRPEERGWQATKAIIANTRANIIRITPEMRERILEEGIPSFGAGGIVDITQGTDPSMVDRVGNFMKERM